MSQQGSGSNARVGTHWFGSLGKLHTSRERRGGIDFLSNLRLRRSAFHTGSGCRIPSSHVRLAPLRMTLSATRATTCEVRRSYVRHFSRHFSGNPPTIECLSIQQLRLRGMNESQIQEAMKVADIVVGFSEYLYKTDYSLDKWMEELRAMMKHIKGQKPPSCKASSGG